MLQRHKWCFRTRHLLYPRFALSAQHEYQHVRNQWRTLHTVTESNQPDNDRKISQSKSSSPSVPGSGSDTSTRKPAQSNHVQEVRKTGSWIDPSSLFKSLEVLRQANRDGTANDYPSARDSRRRWRKSVRSEPQFGPWVGMKVLRIAPSSPAQNSVIKQKETCPPLLSEWRCSESLPDQLRLPWLFRLKTKTTKGHMVSAEEQLCAEIEACDKYFAPSSTERRAAVACFTEIQSIIGPDLGSDASIDLIGSRASGIDGPFSDLDINVRASVGQDLSKRRNLSKQRLLKIKRSLSDEQYADRIVLHAFLDKTRVPIVTGTHLPSGLEFQIQNMPDVRASLEVTRASIAEFPSANALFKIVRQMLSMRGLNKAIHGGVTSYPLLNMIVTSLKLAPPHILIGSVASQLLHVLDFWSELNTEKNKIVLVSPIYNNADSGQDGHAIDPISTVPKVVRKSHDRDVLPHLLSLEDPADPSNDLGARSYCIKHVQACFIEARNNIRAAMQEWNRNLHQSELDQDSLSLLDWCLGGDYTAYEESRLHLRRYGEEIKFGITDT